MIFEAFEPITYDDFKVVDIIRDYRSYIDRVIPNYQLKEYVITGDPTPERLCSDLYDNPNLMWVLIYLNDIYDPWHGWVKSQTAVYDSAEQIYEGKGGVNQIVYHTDSEGERYYELVEHPEKPMHWYHMNDTRYEHLQYFGYLHPVPVYTDQESKNEEKRIIVIIDPSDIKNFIDEVIGEIDKVRKGEETK